MKLLFLFLLLSFFMLFPNQISAQYSGVDGSYDPGSGGGGDSNYGGQDNGGYTGCDGGPPTFNIQGKVYQDNNQNGVFDGGDVGIAGQNIQLIHTESGAIWNNTSTDANGNYTMTLPTNTQLRVRHSTGLPSGAWRINPTGDTLIVQPNCPRSYNWGIYSPPSFFQYAPGALCSGTTTTIPLAWSSYPGASSYKILHDNPDDGVGPSDNTITSQLSFNMTPSQGISDGQRYTFVIVALNGSGNAIAYTDGGTWSHQKYGGYTTASNCSPPGPFQFNAAPIAWCQAANDSKISFNWSPASGATYYTVHAQSNIRGYQAITSTSGTAFTYTIPNPIPNGEGWEFTVRAYNNASSTPINGGSSYYVYGWTAAQQCNGPGAFSWHSAPTALCSGNTSQMRIRWTPASGATSYRITPQTTNTSKGNNPAGTGWMQPINVGNPATQAGGYKEYIYNIPGVVVPYSEGWEFTIAAINALGESGTTGGSSYYHYSWILALNCLPVPTVTFNITTQNGTYPSNGIPARANQNSPVTLTWSATNTPTSCTAASSPTQSYWNGSIATSGSQAVTTSSAGGPITFYLQCSNTSGPSANHVIQLIIDQYPKPYIQTTGGDVHTNEDIFITP